MSAQRLIPADRSAAVLALLIIGAALVVLGFFGVLLAYAGVDGYLDHMEPNIAIPSWRWLHGQAIYPRAGEPIGFLTTFGPLVYLINGLFLAIFGGSIFISKLAGLIAAAASLTVFTIAFRDVRPLAAIAVGVLALTGFMMVNSPSAFSSRPDSFLLLLATCGLAIMREAGRRQSYQAAALALGAVIGMAVNLKVHAFLYFLPAVFWFSAGERTLGSAFRIFFRIVGVSVAVFLLPFLLPGISLVDYLSEMLRLIPAVSHDSFTLLKVVRFSVLYLVPAVAFLAWMRMRMDESERRNLAYAGALIISLLLLFYPAATTGAGAHHLLPFAPFAVDLLLRCWERARKAATLWRSCLVVFSMTVVAIGVPKQRLLQRQFDEIAARPVASDLRALLAASNVLRVEMGYGSSPERYRDTFVRPILVFAGQPFTLEAMTFMELRHLHQKTPSSAIEAIANCASDIWLTPKGEPPFSMRSYYGGSTFGDDLPQAFLGAYRKTSFSRYFDVWSCQTGSPRQ